MIIVCYRCVRHIETIGLSDVIAAVHSVLGKSTRSCIWGRCLSWQQLRVENGNKAFKMIHSNRVISVPFQRDGVGAFGAKFIVATRIYKKSSAEASSPSIGRKLTKLSQLNA